MTVAVRWPTGGLDFDLRTSYLDGGRGRWWLLLLVLLLVMITTSKVTAALPAAHSPRRPEPLVRPPAQGQTQRQGKGLAEAARDVDKGGERPDGGGHAVQGQGEGEEGGAEEDVGRDGLVQPRLGL